jgi:hypothetical protein
MNRLREYQRGILSEDTGTSGGHVISAAPARSIVERPALSIVEGITLPGTDTVYSWTLDSVGNWRRTSRTPAGGAAVDEIRMHNWLHQVVKAGDVELAYADKYCLTSIDVRIKAIDIWLMKKRFLEEDCSCEKLRQRLNDGV